MRLSRRFVATTLIIVFGLAAAMFVPPAVSTAPQVPPSAPVTVVNTADNPVPVTGTLGVGGTVEAAQSGTWEVSVSNFPAAPPPVQPISAGGQMAGVVAGETAEFGDLVASALSIRFNNGARDLIFLNNNVIVARFPGEGNDSVNLALTRPIAFNSLSCSGPAGAKCIVGWVGNLP